MPYTLNLDSAVCQLYLDKTGEKRVNLKVVLMCDLAVNLMSCTQKGTNRCENKHLINMQ